MYGPYCSMNVRAPSSLLPYCWSECRNLTGAVRVPLGSGKQMEDAYLQMELYYF